MATSGQDSIDEIIGQAGLKSIDDAIAKMNALFAAFEKTANGAKLLDAALQASGKSGGGGIGKQVQQMDEMAKLSAKIVTVTNQVQAANSDLNVTLKEQQSLLKQANIDAQLKAKNASHELGSINAMRSELKSLQSSYDAMGKAARDAHGGELLKRIQDVDGALKKLEATTGRHQRSVGNYQGAVFSLSQVLRELPAFTYSAQQGFLAIGNNMPILIDQFKILSRTVDASTGKVMGAAGALRAFAGSIFSFVNVFTILSGLFTIFYKEITAFVMGVDLAKEASDGLAKSLTQGGYSEAVKQFDQMQRLILQVRDNKVSAEKAVELYNTTLGKTLGTVTQWSEAETIIISKADIWLKYMALKTEAQAMFNEAANTSAEIAAKEFEGASNWNKFVAGVKTIVKSPIFFGTGEAYEDILKEMLRKDKVHLEDKRKLYTDEGKKREKEALELQQELGIIERTGGKSTGGSSAREKEVNRIAEMKDAMEREQNALEVQRTKENLSDLEFFEKSIRIRLDYSNKVEKLGVKIKTFTKNELNDFYKFNADMLNDYRKLVDDIDKEFPNRGVGADMVDSKPIDFKEHSEKQLAELNKLNNDIQKDVIANAKRMQAQLDREAEMIKDRYLDIARSAAQMIMNIQEGVFEKEMMAFDTRERRLEEHYNNEMRFIEQSGMAAADKERAKQELEAVTEAKRKKIDQERTTALIRQAKANKALTIAAVTLQTTLAVVMALTDKTVLRPELRLANAIAMGVSGAAQIARAIATPLPQYAKGRGKGKDEFALVGEAGKELLVRGDGSMEVVDRPTITHLKPDDQVFNKEQVLKGIQHSAYVKLMKHDTVTTDNLQVALLQAFEENTNKLDEVKNIIASKQFNATITDLRGYEAYKNTHIR